MRALITGITGFKGSHLAELLLAHDVQVFGIRRWRSSLRNLSKIQDKITLFNADISDPTIGQVIKEVQPHYIFHLAAQSWVPESWRAPHETIYTNVLGTLNVLEGMRHYAPQSKLVIAGSSEEYGTVHADELPIQETNPLRPLSPYAVSKVACDMLGRQYVSSYGLNIVIARAFNTDGPRRSDVFVTGFYARHLAEIKLGLREPVLPMGNMTSYRDFTDVRDSMRGYWDVAKYGHPGEVYNICSGVRRQMGSVVDMLIDMAGVNVEKRNDPSLMRPSDLPVLQGDASKLHLLTGWKPSIPFEQTLHDLLDYWTEEVRWANHCSAK